MKLKRSTRLWFLLFFMVSILNLWIYWKRDQFQYIPYTDYQTLYATDPLSIQHWQDVAGAFSAADLAKGKQILADNGLLSGSTLERIKNLSTFLTNKFGQQKGSPSSTLYYDQPLDVYLKLSGSKNLKAWCGHWGNLFLFFCAAQNITCRYIEVYNPGDHHVFNECYIPELGKWVLMDVYNNILLPVNKQEEYLNAQTFRKEIHTNNPIQALAVKNDTLRQEMINKKDINLVAYHSKSNAYYYYQNLDPATIYHPTQKIKRYLFPQSWYKIYIDNPESNLPYYFKVFCLFVWAGILLYLPFHFLTRKA